ncbi:ABC transporter permease [Paraburkholderia sp. D1E]|uniref:ABC transporter permease n=1 Tax=Paraburkholderia sp. D1E TaxID=3461398 RepID=UPI0040464492
MNFRRPPRSRLLVDLRYRLPSRFLVAWVALIAVGLVAAVTTPATYAEPSINLITAVTGVLLLASLGQLLVVTLGSIDLSVGSLMTLGAAVNVHYLGSFGGSGSFLVAVVLCMGISLLSGTLITLFRLNSLIVTLAVNTIVGATLVLWMGQTFSSDGQAPAWLRKLATRYFFNVSAIFVVAIVLSALTAAALLLTRPGRQLVATGTNRRAARVLGVRVNLISLITFAVAGAFYATAGTLLAGFVRVPNADLGMPYMLTTVTAVGVAGALFSGGPASASSLIAGCLLLQVLDQALAIQNFSPGVRLMVQGVVLILAVAANTLALLARQGWQRLPMFGIFAGKK